MDTPSLNHYSKVKLQSINFSNSQKIIIGFGTHSQPFHTIFAQLCGSHCVYLFWHMSYYILTFSSVSSIVEISFSLDLIYMS